MHVLLIRAHRTHIHFCGRQRSSRTNAEYVAQSYNLFRVLTAQRAGRLKATAAPSAASPLYYIVCKCNDVHLFIIIIVFYCLHTIQRFNTCECKIEQRHNMPYDVLYDDDDQPRGPRAQSRVIQL